MSNKEAAWLCGCSGAQRDSPILMNQSTEWTGVVFVIRLFDNKGVRGA